MLLEINGSLVASNAEAGRWRTRDAPHAAREEVTVNQLKPENLHVDPVLPAGGRGFCCQKTLLLYA
ncbi:hypothetical protein C4K35_3514 [Pseudomonas chlororaphis subsp. piscium]|nr:hypothetical protein C4K35_3514 [Pseudomonas chlororaphis subsp. piscium]AZC57675.1 hypothetical protein C4K34_3510 [Pseudomonas chlororaphis subsp. piscium]AZC76390.1 hypothetical protein C4K31_3487 [Pseudomonas chlororaphis subsp. piscium]AZC89798.1 hypothetical protein C4K29_3497 [Pseudomonas chlororaphis subsp. piscium]AZC96184.1 hypothetical protein C4K28_3456 [Pseudomonas chlororaphis subsp. piscium]